MGMESSQSLAVFYSVEEEEERLLWQINNNTMLYMINFAKETPIKTCNMSLAWEPPYYNDIIILI